MSFYGHEIHVGVDCFSVEPLGLRPGGSLFFQSRCIAANLSPAHRGGKLTHPATPGVLIPEYEICVFRRYTTRAIYQ